MTSGLTVFVCPLCPTAKPTWAGGTCHRCGFGMRPLTSEAALGLLREYRWSADDVIEHFNDRDVSNDPLVLALREPPAPPRIALSRWLYASGDDPVLSSYILHGRLPDDEASYHRLLDVVEAALNSGDAEAGRAAAALNAALIAKMESEA